MTRNAEKRKVTRADSSKSEEVFGPAPFHWMRIANHSAFPYYFGSAWEIIDRHSATVRAHEADRARQERLLDAGLEETFPASDPVAVMRLT